MTPRVPRQRLIGVSLVAIASVIVGYWMGLRSPWFDHHPRSIKGTAQAVPTEDVPFVSFVPEGGGSQIVFDADTVIWKSGDRTDSSSVPPCLEQTSRPVDVTIEALDLSRPFGSGGYVEVITVICPG